MWYFQKHIHLNQYFTTLQAANSGHKDTDDVELTEVSNNASVIW